MNLELLSTVKVIFYFYFFDMHIVWKLPKSCARLTTHDLEEKTFWFVPKFIHKMYVILYIKFKHVLRKQLNFIYHI